MVVFGSITIFSLCMFLIPKYMRTVFRVEAPISLYYTGILHLSKVLMATLFSNIKILIQVRYYTQDL